MTKNEGIFDLVGDFYDSVTLTFSKIQKLSEMATENEAVEIMDIVEDVITVGLKRIDEIMKKAKNENQGVTA